MVEIAKGRPFYKEEGDKAWRLMPSGDYAEIAVAGDAWALADKKRGKQPIASNRGASLWDIGDGVACLERHTKMNAAQGRRRRRRWRSEEQTYELQSLMRTSYAVFCLQHKIGLTTHVRRSTRLHIKRK